MLALRRTGLGATDPTLLALKQRVDQCLRALPIGSGDANAGLAATCAVEVAASMRAQAKQTLLEESDRATMFNIAANMLLQWRNTAYAGGADPAEPEMRRLAAEKLVETAAAVSPTLAVQHLSSAGRIETDPIVLLRIVTGLRDLLIEYKTIPASVRVEALTTLKILADPMAQPNLGVRIGAQVALNLISEKAPDLEMGPVEVETIKKGNKWVPVIAIGATALASSGVIWFLLHRSARTQLSAGPLRQKVEARLRLQRKRR